MADDEISRVRFQLHALERIVRSFRLEMDEAARSPRTQRRTAGDNKGSMVPVSNGISDIFTKGAKIAPTQAERYKPFLPNVYIAYANDADVEVTVSTEGYDNVDTDAVVHPSLVFSVQHAAFPSWMTLEAPISLRSVKKCDSLAISAVATVTSDEADVPPFGISFFYLHDGEPKQIGHRMVPSLSVPQECKCALSSDETRALLDVSATDLKVLVHMPAASRFVLRLMHFEVLCLNV